MTDDLEQDGDLGFTFVVKKDGSVVVHHRGRLAATLRGQAALEFMGVICGWAAVTVREQGTLVYLIAGGVFVAGCGRLLSMSKVGLPQPKAVWLGYLAPELVLPWVLAAAHYQG